MIGTNTLFWEYLKRNFAVWRRRSAVVKDNQGILIGNGPATGGSSNETNESICYVVKSFFSTVQMVVDAVAKV